MIMFDSEVYDGRFNKVCFVGDKKFYDVVYLNGELKFVKFWVFVFLVLSVVLDVLLF